MSEPLLDLAARTLYSGTAKEMGISPPEWDTLPEAVKDFWRMEHKRRALDLLAKINRDLGLDYSNS